jgi:cell division protein FtsW
MKNPPRTRRSPDYLLLFLTVILTAFGLLMVYSASSMVSVYANKGASANYLITQSIAAALGFFAMLVLMNFRHTFLRKLVFLFWIANMVLLALVPFIGNGKEQYGANSWINIGFMNLQPTEFAKLAVLLYLAVVVTNKGDKIKQMKNGLTRHHWPDSWLDSAAAGLWLCCYPRPRGLIAIVGRWHAQQAPVRRYWRCGLGRFNQVSSLAY